MWNIKSKRNKETQQKQMHSYREESELPGGRGGGGLGGKGEGIEMYRLSLHNTHGEVTSHHYAVHPKPIQSNSECKLSWKN